MECVHMLYLYSLLFHVDLLSVAELNRKVGKLNQAKFGVTLTGLLTIFQMRFFEGSLDMSIAVACAIEVENYLKTRRFKHLYSCLIFIGL